MKYQIINETKITNIPWQERMNESANHPLWRYTENPIISRNPAKNLSRVFNSATLFYNGEFIAALRGEETDGIPYIYMARSKDGIKWDIEEDRVKFVDEDGLSFMPRYAYDPRLIKVEDTYYIIWCQDFYGAAIGMAKTVDFKTFTRIENPFLPFNRNAVLFPRKINNMFTMLSRPSDSSHTPFGDIFISQSKDMEFWGRHRHVMGNTSNWWESLKIGAGASPIETSEGWLLIYHGVANTCNGFVYSIGGAILDIDNPSIVKYRSKRFILTPEEIYETTGFVSNVVFPCATLCDCETGRIALYYGAADTNLALAFTTVDTIIDFIKDNSCVGEIESEIGMR